MGATYALMSVVEARSYSRISGATSEEMDTCTSPDSCRMMSRTRCSCTGFRYPCNKHTAKECTPGSAGAGCEVQAVPVFRCPGRRDRSDARCRSRLRPGSLLSLGERFLL